MFLNSSKPPINYLFSNVDDVEDLILGCAFPEAEQGMNLARNVVFLSDLPKSVGGVTVNRFCASSMQAIHQAAGAIVSGSGELFIAGGVESMSRVPMPGFNPMLNPSLIDVDAYIGMGHTAENLAKQHSISREEQEKMALESHHKAASANKEKKFEDEIDGLEQVCRPANLPEQNPGRSHLIVEKDKISGYELRQENNKQKVIEALKSLNFKVFAAGDSYNDINMLSNADLGIFFQAPEHIKAEFPNLRTADTHEELKKILQENI